MATLFLQDDPVVAGIIRQRKEKGQDTYDEVRDGVYVVAPAAAPQHGRVQFQVMAVLDRLLALHRRGADTDIVTGPVNLGTPENYRVPDAAVHESDPVEVFVDPATVLMAVEIVSPGEDPEAKLPFYAAGGVRYVMLVDWRRQDVRLLQREGDGYLAVEAPEGLHVSRADVASAIRWPAAP